MTLRYCYHIAILLLLISSCKEDDAMIIDTPSTPTTTQEEQDEVPIIVPSGEEQYLQLDSDYIYDQDQLHTFELKLPEASLAFLDADPVREEYVEGSLIFEGDTISPVGIRYKGSVGAFVNCVSGADWANPSGYKTCTKLSMKIKINWEGREEKFYKLKKLQFHSQNNDPSQLHDRLAYWLFRDMGVPAPRSTHARLVINGEYIGLFSMVEQIDGRMTRYNFDDGEGNLYKEVWPLTYEGNAQSVSNLLAGLETNEDENPSVHLMRDFATAIVNASEEELQDVITASMDIEEIMSYVVVDRMIRHDDGPFHWYCSGGGCSNHNFFWYEEPENEKLHLIPWDMDNAFANIVFPANPVTPIADEWGETSNNCQPFSNGWLGIQQWSAACDKLTRGWASFEDEYEEQKMKFLNSSFSEPRVNLLLDAWTDQIRAATLEASELHGDAISIQEWESAVNELRQQVAHARNQ